MSDLQDDDGTVIRSSTLASAFPSTADAPRQFGDPASVEDADDVLALRIGSRLGEFEVVRRLGMGGFSIVYLAKDHSLGRTVALKEYLPSSLATRVDTTQVQPRAQHHDTFEMGLKSFINEARLLASFDHPSLVKVYRFWEANGTAYMVMPFYQGQTLKDAIRAMPEPPGEAWLTTLLAPLTEALMVIHADHCYHRDIAPDNVILLGGNDRPLLLDFGAARRVIGDMTQGLTVILKAGYAPVEQYAEVPGLKQGSWTDVYALAALLHWGIVGSTPPPSIGRMLSDSFVPLTQRAAGRYSVRFLQAIDRALAVQPHQRTQTIEAFRRDLGIGSVDVLDSPVPAIDSDATVIRPRGYRAPPKMSAPDVPPKQHQAAGAPPRKATALGAAARPEAPATQPNDRSSRTPLAAGLGVGALVLAAGVWWALQPPAAPSKPDPKEAAAPARPATLPHQGAAPEQRRPDTMSNAEASPPAHATPPANTNTSSEAPAPITAPVTQTPAPEAPVNADPPPTHAEPQPTTPVIRRPPERTTKRPVPGVDSQPTGRTKAAPDTRAECARIMQRLSLGESNPELLERLKTLECG
jgi:serine/threonine protein kinase